MLLRLSVLNTANVPSLAMLMPACTIWHTFTCTERTGCCLQLAAGALFDPWTCARSMFLFEVKDDPRSCPPSHGLGLFCILWVRMFEVYFWMLRGYLPRTFRTSVIGIALNGASTKKIKRSKGVGCNILNIFNWCI